jgi:hypothetical protein
MLADPVVGTAAGLQADQARGQVREERQHLIPLEHLLQHRSPMLIHAVHCKHRFSQIDTNCRNLHDGRSPPQRFRLKQLTAV